MRLFLVILIGLLVSCNLRKRTDPFSMSIESEKAKRDFRSFRNILEKAHPSLTAYISEERKNELFDSISKTLNEPLTLRQFYNKLGFLVNEIGCSHTNVSVPSYVIDSVYYQKLFFPFPVILIDNNLYANSSHVVPPGTRILSVNNVPATRLLDSLTIYNPVDGKHRETQKYLACSDFGYDYFTRFGGVSKFDLLVRDTAGHVKTVSMEAISMQELNERHRSLYYYDVTDVPYFLSVNDEKNYAQLRLTTFEFESSNKQRAFESFLKNSFELLHLKKNITTLIIDLRENGGGDLYNCFLLNSYISRYSFPEYKAVSTRIKRIPYPDLLSEDFDNDDLESINNRLTKEFTTKDQDEYRLADSLIAEWAPDKNHFSKNVVIITNSTVMSSASYFTLLAKSTAGARVIGVETSGSDFSANGFAILKYTLPNSRIGLQFAYAKLLYSNGNPRTGNGIIPDYIVPDSYDSFKENRDQQLVFAIDSLIKNSR